MARRRPAQADAPANPQSQSKLLSLPPELRTIIWELVLHVDPASNGALVLCKLSDRDGEAEEKEGGGKEEHHHMVSSTSCSTILNPFLTCRFILYEAAGIFYAQHPISFLFGVFDTSRFARNVHSTARLNGIQELQLILHGFEHLTKLCMTIRRSFRKLKILRCKMECDAGTTTYHLGILEREGPLIKRALSRFPACVEVFQVRVSSPVDQDWLWDYDDTVAFDEKTREVFKGVFALLPQDAKAEIIVEGLDTD